MKKVKLFVFGLVPTVMMFLVSCSVPNVRAVGKEQHTGIIYILEVTKDSVVFKGEDGTIYEANVTQGSRNILNHASSWNREWPSSSLWGTLFYLETPSGWKALRFTPDPTREQTPSANVVDTTMTYWCGGGHTYCWSTNPVTGEIRPAKKICNRKKR